MAIITIPKILQEKLTDKGADALVRILNVVEERSQSHTLEIAEERFEKRLITEAAQIRADLKSEIISAKAELKDEIATVRADLRITGERLSKRIETEIANLRTELKTDTANTKSELIKWMFIFWVGQFASIVGVLTAILFAFFKK